MVGLVPMHRLAQNASRCSRPAGTCSRLHLPGGFGTNSSVVSASWPRTPCYGVRTRTALLRYSKNPGEISSREWVVVVASSTYRVFLGFPEIRIRARFPASIVCSRSGAKCLQPQHSDRAIMSVSWMRP